MRTKLLLVLVLVSCFASAQIPEPSELSLEGYVESEVGVLKFEFSGKTAQTLYTRLPGSSIIRPDNVCSRGLKVPPTVKHIGSIFCERHIQKTDHTTYKCIANIYLATGIPTGITEEYICGLPQLEPNPLKTPEEEEQGFQKILSGASSIGYPLIQLNGMLATKKTILNGNFSVNASSAEFAFSDEAAQRLYEAMPEHLTVPKGKTCTTGATTRPTIKRSNGIRCARTPSADKKSATYDCYTRLDLDQGWIEVPSEELLCKATSKQ
jgi:hypothetical protein